MGFKSNRFISQVDNELICFICSCVLEKPVQVAACQHAFCNECIQQRLINNEHTKCPFPSCQQEIANPTEEIIPAPRILVALLKKLEIKCDFEHLGCDSVVKLEEMADHVEKCIYDPKERPCVIGCGRIITAKQQLQHQCEQEDFIRILKNTRQEIQVLTEKQMKMNEMEIRIVELERFGRNSMKEMSEKVVAMENSSTKLENIVKQVSLELKGLKEVVKQANAERKREELISASQIEQNNSEEIIKKLEEKCN
jgi:E3 ubiquitin-protein ligase NRDP1